MNYVLVQSATQYYAASPRPASRGETGVPFYSLSPAVSQARIQRRLPTRAGGFSLPSLLPPSATQAGSGSGSPRQQQPSLPLPAWPMEQLLCGVVSADAPQRCSRHCLVVST